MKKIFYLNLVLVLSLLIVACGQTNNANSTDDTSDNSTVISTENKEVEMKENKSDTSPSKDKTFKKSVIVKNPPKHATLELLMEALVSRFNNPKSPLNNEQIDRINDLAKDLNFTTFKDQTDYIKLRRRMVKSIKAEILTPEQLLLYPERTKKKDNVSN